ncbi:response regulator [Sphingobacterium rhinopitheci]|uniref:response regulator n=1 Tax=Sphingobacterium rhinopitheci TaxID=2781960 RepID=UPI001F51B332|nr:response regulator transcription factor [Sphingobacterium rhinopitheci]MCI0919839.1 response regulator transcription factor [Sphingobacterium rhinopitheci]
MIKIILAEDHLVVRNGIKLLLESQAEFAVIGEASSGEEVLTLLENGVVPNILMTDIRMDEMDGLELIDRLTIQYPDIKVIVLSMLNNIQYVIEAFDKGALGYLVKNVGYDELLFCIQHVSKGGRFLCEEISMQLLDKLQDLPSMSYQLKELMEEIDLTERELEVLELIGEGMTNLQIADKLFLSKRTVEGYRQNLLDKTKSKNTASLIKYAVKNSLIS